MKATRIKTLFGGVAAVALAACCLLCALASAPAAYAEGAAYGDVDWSKKGSITLTLATTGDATPVAGAQITLYKVAALSEAEQALVPEAGFEAWDFADLSDADLGTQLAYRVSELGLSGAAATTSSAGSLTFSDLDLGLYLLAQTGSAEGFSDIMPFVVAVPNNEDGTLVYDVDASPKPETASLVDISVAKSWNDANRGSIARPSSVTVQLLRGGIQVGTATLNSSNNWTYTWKGMEKSDGYSVQEASVPSNYKATYSECTANDGTLSFTVTNSTPLPQTGLLLLPVIAAAAAGIALVVIGMMLLISARRARSKV